MKKYFNNIKIIAAFMLCFTGHLHAQQEPQYSQYMYNMMSVNPAYTGTQQALNLLFLSRLQWVGLEGAPRSYAFSMHTPINDKRIGIGASVLTDNIGPVSTTYANFNYAHRVSLSEKLTLSMGLKAGVYSYNVNLTSLDINDNDDSFANNYDHKLEPNFGVGGYLYAPKFYFGVSVPTLIQTNLSSISTNSDQIDSDLKRHYFFTGGYLVNFTDDWILKPSFLGKMVEGAPFSMDMTAQLIYKERFWFGGTYRLDDALIFLFSMQVNPQLHLGYSYDLTVSGLSDVSSGSHEILISFDFVNITKNNVLSPRFF